MAKNDALFSILNIICVTKKNDIPTYAKLQRLWSNLYNGTFSLFREQANGR